MTSDFADVATTGAITDGYLDVQVVRIPADHPSMRLSVLELLPNDVRNQHEHSVWAGHARQIVGWGKAFHLRLQGDNAIRYAARRWDELREHAQVTCVCTPTCSLSQIPALPLAFTSFGFARGAEGFLTVPEVAVIELPSTPSSTAQWGFPWGGWGSARGPRFLITAAWVTDQLSDIDEGDRTSSERRSAPDPWELLGELATRKPLGEVSCPLGSASYETLPGRMTQQQWVQQVARLIDDLRGGAAQKVVMSRDMVVSSSAPIDQRQLLDKLSKLYPTTWLYAIGGLVGATPEMLAAMSQQRVSSRVLAGTISPGQGEELLHSMKDRTEHMFAVESVARALGPITQTLNVPEAPHILDLPNVSHLATDIEATLSHGNLLDVIAALHPTAAVCGTPTSMAYDLLDRYESTERGRYSGPSGWIDGAGEGECGLALRCGQLSEDSQRIQLFAGGGIMPDSQPEVELAETRAKMAPLLQALELF